MKAAKCPSCGCQRDGGDECLHCGIVFAKYFTRAQPAPPPPPAETEAPQEEAPGELQSIFRAIRCVALVVSIMVLYLLFQPSPAPIIDYEPSAAQTAEVKVRSFRRAALLGRVQRLHLNEAELNGWLEANLQLNPTEQSSAPATNSPPVAHDGANEGGRVGDIRSAVQDIRVKLIDDRLRAYVRFALYGKLMSLELEGRLSAREGYLHLDPVAGRLGSLPLPGLPLATALDRLFQSPHNREVFRIPDYVRVIGVDGGHLLVNFQDGEL